MSPTSRAHAERIRAYYVATEQPSYLANWAAGSAGFHFGLGDETTSSLAEAILNANAWLADRAGIRRGTEVLDAGCGAGGSSQWLARELGARVTGITIVPEQVDTARRLAREQGFREGDLVFECRDMCDTGFDDACFDVVYNHESLCHVEDLVGYLRHVMKLVRDGGRFVCIDLCRGARSDPVSERTVCDGWALAFPMRTVADIATAMGQVGMVDVHTEDITSLARRSIEAIIAMAHNTRPLLEAERVMLGVNNAAYAAHVEAAIAIGRGMQQGATALGFAEGTRPPR